MPYIHASPPNGQPAAQTRLSRWHRGPLYVTYDGLDGLANRLRLHFLAHAYALQSRRRLVTQWVRNENCYAGYHDLFDGVIGQHPHRANATDSRQIDIHQDHIG